jgi:DNA polymerase (family 10)
MAPMGNNEIAEVLEEIADMLELRDDNFYHQRAYRVAADSLRDYPEPIASIPRDKLKTIDGIGHNLAARLATLLDTGELPLLTELREKYPRSLLDLKNVPGLGINRIKILVEILNIRSREDLKLAVDKGALAKLRGFGPKLQERLRTSLADDTAASKETPRRVP